MSDADSADGAAAVNTILADMSATKQEKIMAINRITGIPGPLKMKGIQAATAGKTSLDEGRSLSGPSTRDGLATEAEDHEAMINAILADMSGTKENKIM